MGDIPTPKLKRDWEGLIVRLNVQVSTNGGDIFPEGTEMLVTRNWKGLHLEYVEACKNCRLKHRHHIRGVSEAHVEIIGRSKPL